VGRILENWKQKILMILAMMTEMMMVVAVIFQDLDYGDRDDCDTGVRVVTGNFYSPPNRPLLNVQIKECAINGTCSMNGSIEYVCIILE
jgi:hypothetical protein